MRKRALVYICPEYPGFARFGGIGIGMQREAEWFADQGYQVTVLCPTNESAPGKYTQRGTAVEVIPSSRIPKVRSFSDRLTLARRVASLLAGKEGLAICGDFTGPLWIKQFSQPLVVQIHGSTVLLSQYERSNRFLSYFERRTLAISDGHQAISQYAYRATQQVTGTGRKPYCVVPTTPDVTIFHPKSAAPQEHQILFAGGKLTELKGIFVLAAALPAVFREVPNLRLVMVGRDVRTDGSSNRELLMHAIPSQWHSRLIFHERISREQMSDLMNQSRILVVPSLIETFSVVALEAMACGRPVVASNRGGIPEVVRDGLTGILADPERPETFTKALLLLLRKREFAEAMGEEGRRTVQRDYTPARIFSRTQEFHTRLLAGFAPYAASRTPEEDTVAVPSGR